MSSRGDATAKATAQSGGGGTATLNRMQRFVGDRIRSMNYYVGNYVDERLRRVSTKLNGHVMGSADTVAEKIGDIAESTSGDCAYDSTSSPNNLYVSKARVRAISDIRRRRPEIFERLADLAERYLEMRDGGEENSKKSTWLLLRVSELTGSPSSVLNSRMIFARQRGDTINGLYNQK